MKARLDFTEGSDASSRIFHSKFNTEYSLILPVDALVLNTPPPPIATVCLSHTPSTGFVYVARKIHRQ